MRRILIVGLGLAGLGTALAGCGDESPTAVGSELIGPGVTTFEVVLEPEDFLVSDTTYDSLGDLSEASFRLIANQFAGELDAHTLFQISRPFTVTYQPDGGASRTDSLLAIRGARVTLVVDSVASTPGPVALEVLQVTESWHAPSVTWTLRYDTAGVSAPWANPGGTVGPVLGSGTWESGDTVVIEIDSASAAVFQDTAAARNGALIRTTTTGARLLLTAPPRFEFDVVPRENPDTVLTAGAASRTMHIVSPDVTDPPQTELRVGGLPAWRTLLHFKPLESLVVDACGSGGLATGDPACDVPLSEASFTLATLLLDPVPVGGRRIEAPTLLSPRAVLLVEGIDVIRAPLSSSVGLMRDTIPVDLFTPAAPPGARVAVPITGYVRELVDPQDPEEPVSRWLALISATERRMFGYTAFGSIESASPPRLRLVLTIPNPEVFQ